MCIKVNFTENDNDSNIVLDSVTDERGRSCYIITSSDNDAVVFFYFKDEHIKFSCNMDSCYFTADISKTKQVSRCVVDMIEWLLDYVKVKYTIDRQNNNVSLMITDGT